MLAASTGPSASNAVGCALSAVYAFTFILPQPYMMGTVIIPSYRWQDRLREAKKVVNRGISQAIGFWSLCNHCILSITVGQVFID